MHKFSILLTDCCLPSLRTHTHTLVLLYKRRLSEAVCDEFVQSYANACTDDIPKSRHEGTVNNYHPKCLCCVRTVSAPNNLCHDSISFLSTVVSLTFLKGNKKNIDCQRQFTV